MKYLEMVKAARKNGTFAEKQMWDSVGSVSDLLCDIKESHPELYWRFIREQYGIMNNGHYVDREFADFDVSQIAYTDREGHRRTGAHWGCEQIEEATKGMSFPSGTTRYDKYVGFNLFWSDTCKVLTDEQVLKAAYQFYFADEDWPKERGSKVWCFAAMVHGL